MQIQIFDVEHGGCALVTTDTGTRLLIDCGHNASTGWRPSAYLRGSGIGRIDELIITNYDEDHVSDLPRLLEAVKVTSLRRNKSVRPGDLVELKSETGAGAGINRLVQMATDYCHPLVNPTDHGGLSIRSFHNAYPSDFDDENNLSLAVFLHYHNLHIVFPGDLERAGWKRLLQRPEVVAELRQVNVFVASHHGRESGCCEEVFEVCQPEIVIVSDAGIQYDTQATVGWYAERANGISYGGRIRSVFTTRSDGRILITASPQAVTVSTTREEERERRAAF